jgi:hypothetical protein
MRPLRFLTTAATAEESADRCASFGRIEKGICPWSHFADALTKSLRRHSVLPIGLVRHVRLVCSRGRGGGEDEVKERIELTVELARRLRSAPQDRRIDVAVELDGRTSKWLFPGSQHWSQTGATRGGTYAP